MRIQEAYFGFNCLVMINKFFINRFRELITHNNHVMIFLRLFNFPVSIRSIHIWMKLLAEEICAGFVFSEGGFQLYFS